MKLLALAFLVFIPQDGRPPDPTPLAEQERAVSDQELEETIAMVLDALKLCVEAQVTGDLDQARLHVAGALEIMQALGGLRDPKLVASLEAIAGKAGGLGLLPTQLGAREWIVVIRGDSIPARPREECAGSFLPRSTTAGAVHEELARIDPTRGLRQRTRAGLNWTSAACLQRTGSI